MEYSDFSKNKFDDTDFNSGSKRLISTESSQNKKISWETGFSDPNKFDPNKYKLLVYGIQGSAGDAIQMMFLIQQMRDNQAEDLGERINLLEEPYKISQIPMLSTSVISEKHFETFGKAGLVLSAPFENVLDMSPEDAGTNFARPSDVISKSKRQIGTLDELLNQTGDSWNEVRLLGKTNSGEIKVTGVWYKVDKHGNPRDRHTADDVKRLAFKLGLPVLKIPEVKIYPHHDAPPHIITTIVSSKESETGKPYEKATTFAINRGGLRYVIDFERNRFYVVDDELKTKQMTDFDFKYSVAILKKELSPEDQVIYKQTIDSLQDKFMSSKDK